MTRQIIIHKWHRDKPEVNGLFGCGRLLNKFGRTGPAPSGGTPDGVVLSDIECWRPLRD